VLEHRPLELLQRAARLEAKLVGEELARAPIDLQRVALAARAIQRKHQLTAQPLLERVRLDEPFELGHELGAASECEIGVDAVHKRRKAELLKAPDLRLDEVEQREVGERRAAEERERRPERRRGRSRVSVLERATPFHHERFELGDVELARVGVDDVAARARDECLVVKQPPQARDGHANRAHRRVRSAGTEQLLHEVLGRDELVRV